MTPEKRSLCLITPCLPPAFDGLGDFCLRLMDNWPPAAELAPATWSFIVVRGGEATRNFRPDLDVRQIEPCRQSLLEALAETGATRVVLQYVGYGYDAGGHPAWLADGLGEWRKAAPRRHLVVMFHETWASGYPWQRAFWQRGEQIDCARRLLDLSAAAVTSNSATLRDLDSLASGRAVKVIPLGSSFPSQPEREKNFKHVLVLGKSLSRLRALKRHARLIGRLAATGAIEKVVLAGEAADPAFDPGQGLLKSRVPALEAVAQFNFSDRPLPESILSSGLALMHTESTCLIKSTAYQLAAQLGQAAITNQWADPADPLFPGVHYLSYRQSEIDSFVATLADGQTVARVAASCRQLGRTYLAWPEIASQWLAVLAGLD